MDVGETPPDVDGLLSIAGQQPRRQRDRCAELNSSKGHETEVAVEGKVAVGGKQFAELPAALHEGAKCPNWINFSIRKQLFARARTAIN